MDKWRDKILITGGAGFIGHHLVNYLFDNGYQNIVIIDDLSTGRKEWINKKARFINKNINDLYPDELRGIDYVFHLAAQARIQKSWDKPEWTYQNNVEATRKILTLAKQWRSKRVLLTSSNSIYGEWGMTKAPFPVSEDLTPKPLNPYGWHKYLIEEIGKMHNVCWGTQVVVVRPFNVYGPDQQLDDAYCCVFPRFLHEKNINGTIPVYGDGNQSRDFTHVEDVIMGMEKMMNSTRWGGFEIVNICSSVSTRIIDLARMFQHPFECIKNTRKGEMNWGLGNNDKLFNLTGFRPSKSIKEYVNIYAGNKRKN